MVKAAVMEKIFAILVFVLLNAWGNQCEESFEDRLNSLSVELDEKLSTGECNQTLENLEVSFSSC